MSRDFNSMDDLFNQLMGGMRGFNSENRRYLINGREVTPEEFAQYRATGQLPINNEMQTQASQGQNVKQDGILAKLGRNLTQEARDGKLDPVIGRNKEIQETSEILSRRTKNNPVLVGDAGVGKTAVVEGLAQAIVNGDVPAAIKNKEIISIDISGLEAGTQYRGSFEENIQNLLKEVKELGNVILFFDEIHQILGAGNTGDGGSKGLADILKPALSRGELTVIGATTQDEYRNTILKNAALARRFNEVKVNAPSAEDTYKILQGIRNLYEKHHNVILPDNVLKAAVDFSIQYIPQRSLPDKAIDLIDVTAAHLAAQHPVTDVHAVEHQIEEQKVKQAEAVKSEDYEAALNAKNRIEELENKIKNARNINVGIEIKKASNNFLDVNFEIEGIKPQDVEIVTEAIKKEKKFITLSSGEFVKIANKSMEELLGIVDSIGNIKVGKNRISKVKALQLAQISKNIREDLEKLDEFKELFHKIKNRKEVEPKNIKVSLFPYQKLGFNWLKNMYDIGFGGILADDMGLGKTLQTISLLNEVYQENKDFLGLIIVPSSLLYNWKEEIIKFTGITPILVEGVASSRKKIIESQKSGFLITTYQALRNDIEEYKNRIFDIVVLDEAQNIKTTTSQIKKAVMKINSRVNFALTGTPVENNILELWSIFDFVIPGYLDSLSKFKKTYKEAIVNPNSSKINNLREIIAPFLLRRTKKEVLTELPEKMESNVFVTLSSEQKQLYLSYVKQAKKEMKKFDKNENNRIKILAILTKLRQICNSPALFKQDYSGEVAKIEVLKDLMPDITENGHRLLIFSQFVGTLKEIEKELSNMGIEYFYIDGNVKSKERVEICNRFNDGERQVVLISLKAGGTGLNLVGADVVIHYDPWWNIAVENQASDRAYRIGQKKSVQVIKLVTEGTIEEKIIKIQEKKRQLSENLLENKDGEKVLFEMSDKELMELLG